MAVTEADIRKIADLARLALGDDEVPAMTAQLNSILSHMDVLTKIDTSSIESLAGVGGSSAPLREDVVAPYPMNTTAPMLAPQSEDSFILVPRLSTHEDL